MNNGSDLYSREVNLHHLPISHNEKTKDKGHTRYHASDADGNTCMLKNMGRSKYKYFKALHNVTNGRTDM